MSDDRREELELLARSALDEVFDELAAEAVAISNDVLAIAERVARHHDALLRVGYLLNP